MQTYAAKVLIAVNPYRNINGLYAREKIDEYLNDFRDELQPHLYSIGLSINVSLDAMNFIETI